MHDTTPEEFGNAAFFSTVRPTVNTKPSQKTELYETLFRPEEFENGLVFSVDGNHFQK